MLVKRVCKSSLILFLCALMVLIELAAAHRPVVATSAMKLELVSRSTAGISLKWSDSQAVTGTPGYTVFRNGIKIVQQLQTRTFTDTKVTANTKYSYVVKAINKSGVSIRSSNTLHTSTSQPPDTVPPSSPKNLVLIEKSETTLAFRWNPSVDNRAVSRYTVFRNGAKIADVTVNQFSDRNLTAGTRYAYTVRALDAANNASVFSVPFQVTTKQAVTPPPPPPPAKLQSTYEQVYIRGTFNNFAANQKMTLVADHLWRVKVTFTGQSRDRFKFDIYGDWTLNFGDDQGDFIADRVNPRDIRVRNGAGQYTITFNDKTLAYTVTPPGAVEPGIPTDPDNPDKPDPPPTGTPSVQLGSEALTLQAGDIDYLEATVQSGNNQQKLTWTTDHPNVVSVQEETLKALAPGTATIKVAFADQPQIFDTATVTVVDSKRHPVYKDPDLNYVFDMTALPEINIEISTAEWNKLLLNFDNNPQNEIEVMADFSFNKNGKIDQLQQIGIRLRGNTSRRRPEGVKGQLHNPTNPDWKHAHFALKFAKFNKTQRFYGMADMNTKWFKDDAMHAREVYSYDLNRRFDVWTAPFSSYAKLNIKIKESQTTAYFGVYQMIEAINQDYLNKRFPKNDAGSAPGNLWKGTYPGQTGPADLTPTNLDKKIGIEDPDNNIFKTYDLKTNKKTIDTLARPQLEQFIRTLSSAQADQTWLDKQIDVDLFLRALAASVTVGSWDDYWILGNNYYMYFDAQGKMHWIPYDFDNTMGTSLMVKDAGKQDPLRWGPLTSSRPLVQKILAVPQYRAKYVEYLGELIKPENNLFDESKSVARIKAWHKLIGAHIKNDTGEDMEIADRPASWGNTAYYRLFSGDENTNFFKAKTAAIRRALAAP